MNLAVLAANDAPPLPLWGTVIASYLLGALPFGLLLARLVKGVDLRAVGSGNIGATNTMRAMGKGWGLLAFALDFGKGWLPVAVLAGLAAVGDDLSMARLACGSAAVLGHCFPVYLGFRGGKGVATACGAIVAVDPRVFLAGGIVWLVTLGLTRFVGLSSILMGTTFPAAAWWWQRDDGPFVAGCGLLTLLIAVRHRANITRMLKGTEPRMGQGKREAAETSHG